MNCDKMRLQQTINSFAKYGETENGGVTRLTLSEADIEARKYFIERLRKLNVEVKVDDLGNIYGIYEGTENLEPIVIGSHGDSVVKGGNYDGILGVIAGLEVIETLHAQQRRLRHPIIVANFTNEEGVRFSPAMFSTGVLAGVYDEQQIFETVDQDGISFEEALVQSGFAGDRVNRLKEGKAYLELHIEQGPILQTKKRQIGIVEGIVGMCCLEICIKGHANHAGTTPMYLRKDPVHSFSTFIGMLHNTLPMLDEQLVFTIGELNMYPNLHTVIPEQLTFTLDMRHVNPAIINQALEIIEDATELINRTTTTSMCKKILWARDTVEFNEQLIREVANSTEKLAYTGLQMYSGAGHDAQFLAQMMPTTMIFIPSEDGNSHCEDEYSSIDSCFEGVNVLLETVLAIDSK